MGQSMYFSARRIWQYISMENTKARIWREKNAVALYQCLNSYINQIIPDTQV